MAKVGRPPKFQTSEQLEEMFGTWRKSFDKDGERVGEIPDVEGFCDFIDSYRDLFCEYEKKKEFSDTIKRIRNWIQFKKKQLAMQNKMNATVFIFDAKNNAGYVDRTEADVTSAGEKIGVGISADQADQLIRARTARNTGDL